MDFPAVYADNPTGFGTAFKNRAGMRKAMQMYLKIPLFHVILYLFSHRPDTSRANNRPISRKEWLHLQPVHMKTTVFSAAVSVPPDLLCDCHHILCHSVHPPAPGISADLCCGGSRNASAVYQRQPDLVLRNRNL